MPNLQTIKIKDIYFKKYKKYIIFEDENGYWYDKESSTMKRKEKNPIFVGYKNKYSIYNISVWIKTNNKNFEIREEKFINAHSKLKFYCFSCEDIFYMSWQHVKKNIGCPVCSGHQTGNNHSFIFFYPEVFKEWNYRKNKNLDYNKISYGSHISAWWKCSNCNNEWCAVVRNRTILLQGCPLCAIKRRESEVATFLKKYLKKRYNSISEYKIFRNPKTGNYLPYDIYIPRYKIFIEVQGTQHYYYKAGWHINKEGFKYNKKIDRMKKKNAIKNGYFIEVDLRKIKNTTLAKKFIEKEILKIMAKFAP